MTLRLAKGKVSNEVHKTIRDNGSCHDMSKYGYTIAACRK